MQKEILKDIDIQISNLEGTIIQASECLKFLKLLKKQFEITTKEG